MPLDDSSERKVVKKLKSSKNDISIDDIKMDISCKAQNSNITPKKNIKTVMSPIDSITSQDDNFPIDLRMTSEPDLVKTSNVETKFSPTETKNVISKNTAVLSTNSYDTHISNIITAQKIQKVNHT